MISHGYPSRIVLRAPRHSQGRAGQAVPGSFVRVSVGSVSGYGPLCVEYDLAARLQGARVDSSFLQIGSRPRRLRRTLLLSGAGSPSDRRRRKCPDVGDRSVDRPLCPVFGRTRAVRAGALRHQRDAQDRRRGPGDADRQFEASRGDYRPGRVRWPGSQVSDLGAKPVPERARGGHPKVRALKAQLGSSMAARNAQVAAPGARE